MRAILQQLGGSFSDLTWAPQGARALSTITGDQCATAITTTSSEYCGVRSMRGKAASRCAGSGGDLHQKLAHSSDHASQTGFYQPASWGMYARVLLPAELGIAAWVLICGRKSCS